jgi:hypothetical protein
LVVISETSQGLVGGDWSETSGRRLVEYWQGLWKTGRVWSEETGQFNSWRSVSRWSAAMLGNWSGETVTLRYVRELLVGNWSGESVVMSGDWSEILV